MSPLALPDLIQLSDGEALSAYASVALFVERARALLPTLQVTLANARVLAEICVHLDGLPLAIELAAARIRLLSPQALLARLTQRLEVLTGGARTLPADTKRCATHSSGATICWTPRSNGSSGSFRCLWGDGR